MSPAFLKLCFLALFLPLSPACFSSYELIKRKGQKEGRKECCFFCRHNSPWNCSWSGHLTVALSAQLLALAFLSWKMPHLSSAGDPKAKRQQRRLGRVLFQMGCFEDKRSNDRLPDSKSQLIRTSSLETNEYHPSISKTQVRRLAVRGFKIFEFKGSEAFSKA